MYPSSSNDIPSGSLKISHAHTASSIESGEPSGFVAGAAVAAALAGPGGAASAVPARSCSIGTSAFLMYASVPASSSTILRARSRCSAGLVARTASTSCDHSDSTTATSRSWADCRNHLRSLSRSAETPETRPVLGSKSGEAEPSMCSQKRTALAPCERMSSSARESISRSSSGECDSGARANGRKRTLPML